jgi:AbrB family looped-hinge helix DNA binding protein
MITTVMTSGGQVVIPTKIRRKLNIKNGTRLSVEEGCDEIILKRMFRILLPAIFFKNPFLPCFPPFN